MLVRPSATSPLEGQDSVITCDHGKNSSGGIFQTLHREVIYSSWN